MPIYAYRCEACGHELDALQKVSDAALTDCPACGAAALKKQLTAAAFRLKGGGWYETDFKQNGKKNLHDSGDKTPTQDAKTGGDKSTSTDTATAKAGKSAATPAKGTPSQAAGSPA
ncbi:zinc ribbon domain-containing protein [uncultured Thiohalocapsa sp.]|uniref:FmdB family zinc ribbon protein n=1 Tax=uncultured Thiohalocapsa sp. TaxID=768990 RepID=UPI0025DDB35C|nr:zinc ribbon domain-containing protein [uncultured Thiohalocapsa sp.]